MSSIRKYVGLPDLVSTSLLWQSLWYQAYQSHVKDPAPDIYETPDLIDDTSTHPTSGVPRSESADSTYYDPLAEDVNVIDRHRINQDEARTHFVTDEERDSRLGSRISGKRKLYKSSDRPIRKDRQDIINGIEVSSDEDESLDRKLARLRREVAEVQDELERKKHATKHIEEVEAPEEGTEIDSLSLVLNSISTPGTSSERTAVSRLVKQLGSLPKYSKPNFDGVSSTIQQERNPDFTTPYGPTYQGDQGISKITAFDARLSLLEAALGIDAIPLPTQEQPSNKALLPTLDALDKQLSTLLSSTDASINHIKERVKELTQEAESLERKRSEAKRAQEAPSTNGEPKNILSADDAEQVSKINALYGTLRTIESLAPLLPSVLDRLRSLQSLHADAAAANQRLTNLENRQVDMKQELQGWREGLDKIEKAMQQGEEAMKSNTEVMEGWVRELEGRLKNLA
ncbi:MAG: hypothetical protein Q9163_000662 [Psora crenata]